MKKMQKCRRSIHADSGSVMMEYIILSLGLFVVLAMAAHFMLPDFTPQTAYRLDNSGNITFVKDEEGTAQAGSYGRLGTAFMRHYNMVLDIVSMPYP